MAPLNNQSTLYLLWDQIKEKRPIDIVLVHHKICWSRISNRRLLHIEGGGLAGSLSALQRVGAGPRERIRAFHFTRENGEE